MGKNYMTEIARMLGVEIGEPFDAIVENGISSPCGPFYFDENWKIRDNNDGIVPYWFLEKILIGEYTIQKRPWRPKVGDAFFYVLTNGEIQKYVFEIDNIHTLMLFSFDNCFPTEEAARAAVPEMLEKFEKIKKGVRE